MIGPVGREHAQYRKGLVLGFTVAETILLLLFALLLALALLLARQEKRILGAEEAAKVAESARVDLEQKLTLAEARAEVAEAARDGPIPDDFVQELVRTRERAVELDRQSAVLSEREKVLAADESLALATEQAGRDGVKRVKELASLGLQAETLMKADKSELSAQNMTAAIRQAADVSEAMNGLAQFQKEDRSTSDQLRAAASEMSTLRGQVAKFRNDLAAVGKGGELPPCWITEVGRVQYLFDVALSADGSIAVRDTTPPERQLDRSDLPVPAALFSRPLQPSEFLTLTSGLLDYSNERECRFFVRIKDETADEQKTLFKSLLLTVESHFYKYLMQ